MLDSILNGTFKASALGFVISSMVYFTGGCSKAPEEAPSAAPVAEASETTGEEKLDVADVLKEETSTEDTKTEEIPAEEPKTEEAVAEK